MSEQPQNQVFTRRLLIVVIVIPLIVAILANVFSDLFDHGVLAPLFNNDAESESESINVYVQDNSRQPISNAKVVLLIEGGYSPPAAITDSNGVALLQFPTGRSGTKAVLNVDADGYEQFMLNTEIIYDGLPVVVQLTKLN